MPVGGGGGPLLGGPGGSALLPPVQAAQLKTGVFQGQRGTVILGVCPAAAGPPAPRPSLSLPVGCRSGPGLAPLPRPLLSWGLWSGGCVLLSSPGRLPEVPVLGQFSGDAVFLRDRLPSRGGLTNPNSHS